MNFDFRRLSVYLRNGLVGLGEENRHRHPLFQIAERIMAHYDNDAKPKYRLLAPELRKAGLKTLPEDDFEASKKIANLLGDVKRARDKTFTAAIVEYFGRAFPEELAGMLSRDADLPGEFDLRELVEPASADIPARPSWENPDWKEAISRIEEEHEERSGSLSLAGLSIQDVPHSVTALPWLKNVTTGDTRIKSFGWMSHLNEIEALDVSHSPVSKLLLPETAKSLKRLTCIDTALIDFQGLDFCKSLELINCQRTETLRSLAGIEKCVSLRTFVCSMNFLREMHQLRELSQLNELVMSSTDLLTLDGLPCTDTLMHVDVSNTRLRSLIGIENAGNLRTFKSRENKLPSLIPLSSCKHLHTVDLRGAKIGDISRDFWTLRSLKEVKLTGGTLEGVPEELLQGDESGNCLGAVRKYVLG